MVSTAPQLFALSHGSPCPAGPHACFYCGAPCDEDHSTAEHVKSSFTGLGDVAAPGSPFVCAGCVLCLQERISLTTHDGQQREGQRVRGYSWVLTSDRATPCTKADREFLLATCLDPPAPPFVICISDSGQKHLLYRAVACHSREIVAVTLEAERVAYRPADLAERVTLCKKLIAATGKPALAEQLSARGAMSVISHHEDESVVSAWLECREQPLSRLAAWLSPAKEDCLRDYPCLAPAA